MPIMTGAALILYRRIVDKWGDKEPRIERLPGSAGWRIGFMAEHYIVFVAPTLAAALDKIESGGK